MSPESTPPHVVTLAALYGAGGGVIGPRVAERLEVPFLDRQIPEEVARSKGISHDAVSGVEEHPQSASERFVSAIGRASTVTGETAGMAGGLDRQEGRIRGYIEEFVADAAQSGWWP